VLVVLQHKGLQVPGVAIKFRVVKQFRTPDCRGEQMKRKVTAAPPKVIKPIATLVAIKSITQSLNRVVDIILFNPIDILKKVSCH
jgi:hypothetical protein